MVKWDKIKDNFGLQFYCPCGQIVYFETTKLTRSWIIPAVPENHNINNGYIYIKKTQTSFACILLVIKIKKQKFN